MTSSWLPVFRSQAGDELGIAAFFTSEAIEHLEQILLGIVTGQVAILKDRVEDRAAATCIRMSDKSSKPRGVSPQGFSPNRT